MSRVATHVQVDANRLDLGIFVSVPEGYGYLPCEAAIKCAANRAAGEVRWQPQSRQRIVPGAGADGLHYHAV